MLVSVSILDAARSFDRPYTYIFPESLGTPSIGQLVSVPFGRGKREVDALIVKIDVASESGIVYKRISNLLRLDSIITESQIDLAHQIRRRYICTFGQALKLMVPRQIALTKDLTAAAVALADPESVELKLAQNEFRNINDIRVAELLLVNEVVAVQEVMVACAVSQAVINRMVKNGLLVKTKIEVERNQIITAPDKLELPQVLNTDQKNVYEQLKAACDQGQKAEFLLNGITGSGKTEIYLHVAEHVLRLGKSVIVLVPEIALTPLMVGRIVTRFGDKVAIIHSRLSLTARYEQWKRIKNGEVRFVVGARSAIFAPLANVGLIVVDEEHEDSYKAERQAPFYHAVTVAQMRAELDQAVLILGSATPSITSYYRTQIGESTLLEMPRRIGEAVLPRTKLINMRNELASGNPEPFSRHLEQEIERNLLRGEQMMLFQNRRGFFNQLVCKKCGAIAMCDDCDISLTLHVGNYGSGSAKLICHCCGKVKSVMTHCPECGQPDFKQSGVGTEQLTDKFNSRFAPARALRMDLDTTLGKNGHERILSEFSKGFGNGERSCLIGTQMIAKGHDFADVTLVGIMDAHQLRGGGGFNGDFRLFQLVTQAAGRAGRGTRRGRVVVQTLNPDDPILHYALNNDYLGFYKWTLEYRKRTFNPPFAHLARIVFVSKQDSQLKKLVQLYQAKIEECVEAIKVTSVFKQLQVEVMPAMPHTLARAHGAYRYTVLVKSNQQEALQKIMRSIYKLKAPFDYFMQIDVDPLQ